MQQPRNNLVDVVRVAAAGGAIWWLARSVSFQDLPALLHRTDVRLLGAAIALFLLTPVFQAVRLRWLLAARRIDLPLADSIGLAFAGNLLNYAAPLGSTAGDVYKAVRVARRDAAGVEGATIVLLDRAVGLVTLLASVALIAWIVPSQNPIAALRGYLLMIFLILAASAVGVVVMTSDRLPRALADRLAGTRAGKIGRAIRTVRALLANPLALAGCVLATLLIQIAAAASFLCVAVAVGFTLDSTDTMAIYAGFSTGEIVKALPGPPQGLGSMELAYATLFKAFARPEAIVASALLIRLVGLVCALPGSAVLWAASVRVHAEPVPVGAAGSPA